MKDFLLSCCCFVFSKENKARKRIKLQSWTVSSIDRNTLDLQVLLVLKRRRRNDLDSLLISLIWKRTSLPCSGTLRYMGSSDIYIGQRGLIRDTNQKPLDWQQVWMKNYVSQRYIWCTGSHWWCSFWPPSNLAGICSNPIHLSKDENRLEESIHFHQYKGGRLESERRPEEERSECFYMNE